MLPCCREGLHVVAMGLFTSKFRLIETLKLYSRVTPSIPQQAMTLIVGFSLKASNVSSFHKANLSLPSKEGSLGQIAR